MVPEEMTNVGESQDLLKILCGTMNITPEEEEAKILDELEERTNHKLLKTSEDVEILDEFEERKNVKRLKVDSLENIEEEIEFRGCENTKRLANGLLSPENGELESNYAFSDDINYNSCYGNVCLNCGLPILETFVLKLKGFSYHEHCLCCSVCKAPLGEAEKCFFRDGNIYCKDDFINNFGTKCAKCDIKLNPTDWVRQVDKLYFHLDCFSCSGCNIQLATGDDFGLKNGKLLCKTHFLEIPKDAPEPETKSRGQKRKGARTTFADDQLAVLQEYFKEESNPQGQALTEIAEKVKLSRRVTQIWFQNTRAKIRQQKLKHLA